MPLHSAQESDRMAETETDKSVWSKRIVPATSNYQRRESHSTN